MALPISLGLGGAVVLATGALALLEERDDGSGYHAAGIGLRLSPPATRDVDTERTLRSVAAPERLARLDLALRAAALDLADAGARARCRGRRRR